MTAHYRALTTADHDDYLALMLAAYAPVKALGIHFDAATADLAKVTRHLQQHGVYALFIDQQMVASVTIRYPWGPLPGPFGLPHIGWFGAHPAFNGQGYGNQLLNWLEQEVLRGELKAPAVSLGTATSHPWLRAMYLKRGFQPMHETDLGKGHITLYMKKVLDEASHAEWLAHQPLRETRTLTGA
ncbi:GNAT family N-acetyltransferase [Erwiniaceae bacterium BAC15a-03b]|uniref:GNAT family N-acetyltransferase n=1 Tax=Winslowiella arboricola TaxID=2978220 RepID=A0A9J6PQ42_9GAMM|nr:GNAT family N-acetyltransferase [Winslowiella arboricola]MCU5773610.1 GNAT family N-acetyltransferase [Winslowiella arboricola]MCU5778491.1 GNAT family N-acetyltransferase [Winslowiella arboricola]